MEETQKVAARGFQECVFEPTLLRCEAGEVEERGSLKGGNTPGEVGLSRRGDYGGIKSKKKKTNRRSEKEKIISGLNE